eukprot:2649400-Pleurochrysis_carterae.AAC.1
MHASDADADMAEKDVDRERSQVGIKESGTRRRKQRRGQTQRQSCADGHALRPRAVCDRNRGRE